MYVLPHFDNWEKEEISWSFTSPLFAVYLSMALETNTVAAAFMLCGVT